MAFQKRFYMAKFLMRGEFKRQRDSSLDWIWTVKRIDVDSGWRNKARGYLIRKILQPTPNNPSLSGF
jgi:hypothetical protein